MGMGTMGVLMAYCCPLAAGGKRGRHQGNATGARSSTIVPLFSELLVARDTQHVGGSASLLPTLLNWQHLVNTSVVCVLLAT